jgi:hypothetical protein
MNFAGLKNKTPLKILTLPMSHHAHLRGSGGGRMHWIACIDRRKIEVYRLISAIERYDPYVLVKMLKQI